MSSIWQYSAGTAGRRFDEVVIRDNVLIVGPGELQLNDPPSRDHVDYAWLGEPDSNSHWTRVRAIDTLEVDDIVILRRGVSTILAVGVVTVRCADVKTEDRVRFEDVSGWNLSHVCRVAWTPVGDVLPDGIGAAPFGTRPSTLTRCNNAVLQEWARGIVAGHMNDEPPAIQYDCGLERQVADLDHSPSVELLADTVARFRSIDGYYDPAPSEHEVVAHIVVPMLEQLGWGAGQLALEWPGLDRRGHIDVAVFRGSSRLREDLQFLIEAKRLRSGIDQALEQVRSYSADVPVLITDGQRYEWYDPNEKRGYYLNLRRVTDEGLGLIDMLRTLAPVHQLE